MPSKKKPLQLLFDADMLCFESCAAVEEEIHWGDGLWTLHADANVAQDKIDSMVKTLTMKVLDKLNYDGQYDISMCFSDSVNFRKRLYPLYKANRIGKRKPVCYSGVVDWCKQEYTTYQRDTLEADDCLGILSTMNLGNAVIISGDKDFKTVPGMFFDYRRGEFHKIDQEEADKAHLFQTLIGDTADNYPGCPGIGEKTAEKLLLEKGVEWDTVVGAFEKKGLTEEDALLQARVARILRKEDYNFKTKEPILWNP